MFSTLASRPTSDCGGSEHPLRAAPSVTVLIADDDAAIRRLVALSISSSTYEIVEAIDGEKAWEVVQKLHPALLVLDNRMPGLSGIEVCRKVRAVPSLAATRILMLTANKQPQEIEEGLAAGADAYLTKPFSPLKLMMAVDDLLWTHSPEARSTAT